MLEIKNITKIYHSKHTEDVVALDDISINFGDKGLVFLLGKSGSGKSTVLNTVGGLDSFDKGEIIINGKSSKDFKQKDFDAYRNTYIGFIFQEYNVLPDFTVAQNIGLALELQGKKADPSVVNGILETVDLVGYGDRKPNQLSGGQKQRIAIARALVKEPQIIMADEPTGALDSNTGRQVFETLRKLGNDKLVIVVSHDRESAELYADRIIELKDGRILSDRVQKYVQPKMMSPNVSLVQNNLVHIQGGKLTLQDRQFIDKLVSTTNGDIFISASPDINKDIRQSAKINASGQSSVLVNTTNQDVKVNATKQEFNLIRGKMRGRDTFKMGASSLKSKKGKLVVSIILAIIAMALFGFADTMACFNSAQNMYQTIQSSETKTFALKKVLNTKNYVDPESNYSYYDNDAKATQEDLDAFKAKYTDHTFLPVYSASLNLNYYQTDKLNWYTSSYISKGFYLNSSQYSNYGLTLMYGNYPTSADEVAITALQYECYKLTNLRDETDYTHEIQINDYNDLIGQTVDGKTIVGIIDTHFPEDAQKAVLDKNSDYNLLSALNVQPLIESGFHYGVFYGQQPALSNAGEYVNWSYEKGGSSGSGSMNFFINGNNLLTSPNTVLKRSISTLSGTQVIMCYYAEPYDTPTKYRIQDLDISEVNSIEELRAAVAAKFASPDAWENYYTNTSIRDYYGNSDRPFEIVGVSFVTDDSEMNSYYRGLCGTTTKELGMGIARIGQYDSFITCLTGSNLDKDLVYSCADFGSTEDRFLIQNEASGFLKNFYNIIQTMAQVFLYIGLFFAVFATLLIMSFISNSIAYKKKEIGILRALGATGHDVYRIFTWESLIIVAIIFLISSVLVGVGAFAVNFALKTKAGLYLSLLSFGLRQIGILGGVCLLIGLVASWLPTRKISRMKPIDAIQERK